MLRRHPQRTAKYLAFAEKRHQCQVGLGIGNKNQRTFVPNSINMPAGSMVGEQAIVISALLLP